MDLQWTCAKCGGSACRVEQTYFGMKGQHPIWSGMAGLKKSLDVGKRAFSVVICHRCSYTELYQVSTKQLAEKLALIRQLQDAPAE